MYSHHIGDALGIEGAQQTAPDLTTLQPDIDVNLNGNHVDVNWGWGGYGYGNNYGYGDARQYGSPYGGASYYYPRW